MKSNVKKPRKNNVKKAAPVCYFKQSNTVPDYKDVLVLKRFVTDRGKIMHHSFSGVTAKNQRLLSQAIKRARYMGLMAYTDKHAL